MSSNYIRRTSSPMFNILDVLAVCCAAFRINNNLMDTNDNAYATKNLIKAHFLDSKIVNVTQEDIDQAEKIKQYLPQRMTMTLLSGGQMSDFCTNVVTLVAANTVHHLELGIIAWAPKLYADYLQRDAVTEQVSIHGINSKILGSVGDKIELTFHLIESKHTSMYDSYYHTGHDGNGNLVSFYSKIVIPNGIKIKARIKKYFQNPTSTILHYIRVQK